ncbi:hypothetical protein ABPG75_010256 [Micractinium tetrahymenae]
MPGKERQTSIHEVPDALLARCMGLLPETDRHSGSLQDLELGFDLACESEQALEEAAALVNACLAAGGAGGALRRLKFWTSDLPYAQGPAFTLGDWAPCLTSLQRLEVGCRRNVRLLCAMQGLSQLQSLELTVRQIVLGPGVGLPPSLTRLVFVCSGNPVESLHHLQVGNLSRLRSLSLSGRQGADELDSPPVGGLSGLRSLQHLSLTDCTLGGWLPAAAGHWTCLQVLEISQPIGEVAVSLQQALQALTGLTGLFLEDYTQPLPQAAARLGRLRWLYWHSWGWCRGPQAALQPGPWQRSLRCCVLEFHVAMANAAFLEGCPQLERISFANPPYCSSAASGLWDALWAWAAAAPWLRCLDFMASDDPGSER